MLFVLSIIFSLHTFVQSQSMLPLLIRHTVGVVGQTLYLMEKEKDLEDLEQEVRSSRENEKAHTPRPKSKAEAVSIGSDAIQIQTYAKFGRSSIFFSLHGKQNAMAIGPSVCALLCDCRM